MQTTFNISTDQSKLDVPMIVDFLLNQSYWAKERNKEMIEKSIDNSLCFGVYNAVNKQVGFARVVTDYAVYAWIMDVFILEEYRGKGLGKLLMNAVMTCNDLQGLKRFGLATRDAHKLYEQFGFTSLAKPEYVMENVK
ncbi:MAG: GNAT family N-acetyltransferase [Ferruginibacter sp.]